MTDAERSLLLAVANFIIGDRDDFNWNDRPRAEVRLAYFDLEREEMNACPHKQ